MVALVAELDAKSQDFVLISGSATKQSVILDWPLYLPGPQFPQLQ